MSPSAISQSALGTMTVAVVLALVVEPSLEWIHYGLTNSLEIRSTFHDTWPEFSVAMVFLLTAVFKIVYVRFHKQQPPHWMAIDAQP